MSEPNLDSMATISAEDGISDPLELLASMGQDFADSRDIEETMKRGLARIIRSLDAEGGALFMLDESGKRLTCTCSVGATEITGISLPSDQGIVGRSVQNNRGEIVRDVRADPGFYAAVDSQTGYVTRSILCAPISIHDRPIGAIELINKKRKDPRFSAIDLQVLETMAATAGLAIHNAKLTEALMEQERIRHELELAAEIQRGLLPAPRDEAFPIHGTNIPARVVSGDFYDFFELSDGRICFNLGDVAGKGLNAALLMAKAASLYRCLGKTVPQPGRLLALINAELWETTTRGMFITMVGGIYDPETGLVRLANAGHEPPLLHRADGSFAAFPAEAPPLGVIPPDSPLEPVPETHLYLERGSLYIFSDGVTEGYVMGGMPLEIDGLKAVIVDQSDLPLRRRLEAVVSKFEEHGSELRDDVTMLGIDDRHRTEVDGWTATRSPGPPDPSEEKLLSMTVPAEADRLGVVRRAVTEAATLCGCSETVAFDLTLAVDEACQNVIRHAYKGDSAGTMTIDVVRRPGAVVVMLTDHAAEIDVRKVRPRDIDDVRPGGLGTHLMHSVLDEIEFLPSPPGGGNILKMVKRVH